MRPRGFVLAVVVIAACSSPSGRTGGPAASGDPHPARVNASGLDYERGAGVPRDFALAARAHDTACKGGDKVACHRYALLVRQGRGVEQSDDRAKALFLSLCDGGDHAACLYIGRTELPKTGPRFAKVKAACTAGDDGACVTFATVMMADPDDDTRVSDIKPSMIAACKASYLRACQVLFGDLGDRCELLVNTRTGPACDEALRTYAAKPGNEAMREGLASIDALCAAGDVDACAYLPGKAIPERALCTANDYLACQSAAYDGAFELAPLACEAGGLASSCRLAVRQGRASDKPDAAKIRTWLERGCKLAKAECAELASPEAMTGCEVFDRIRVPAGTRPKVPDVMGVTGARVILPRDLQLNYSANRPGLDVVRPALMKAKIALVVEPDVDTMLDQAKEFDAFAQALNPMVKDMAKAKPAWGRWVALSNVAVVIDGRNEIRGLMSLQERPQDPADVIACTRNLLAGD